MKKLLELKLPKKEKHMLEPATEPQLQFLKKLGHDIENTKYTKYDACKIIHNSDASGKQIRILKNKGYDVSDGCTIGQAFATFRQLGK